MIILDETVGSENWQRSHELINGNLFCNVSIFCGGEWVTKQDVGVESFTEKEKGQASDSFKRACFNWGLGRELYTAPYIWVNAANFNLKQNDKGKWITYDRFEVDTIEIQNKRITGLTIRNSKTGNIVYTYKEQNAVKCPKCGNLVKGFTRPDGTKASPEDVIANLGMCVACSKKA